MLQQPQAQAVVLADHDPWAFYTGTTGAVPRPQPARGSGGGLPAVPFAQPEEAHPVAILEPTTAERAARDFKAPVSLGRPETHNHLRQLAAMPWYVLEEQLRGRVVNIPRLHFGESPEKNLTWVLCGFDASVMTYPAHHLFPAQTEANKFYNAEIRDLARTCSAHLATVPAAPKSRGTDGHRN